MSPQDDHFTNWLRWLGGEPCFRVYGKARAERDWRVIDVFATRRRDRQDGWPLWRGSCTTWSAHVIAVGRDFAERLVSEQETQSASRADPVVVVGGRLTDPERRAAAGVFSPPTAAEIMAHECGHTWQALRLRALYLPLVGSTTLFREGPRPWNRFENEASEVGQFGGILLPPGTITAASTSSLNA